MPITEDSGFPIQGIIHMAWAKYSLFGALDALVCIYIYAHNALDCYQYTEPLLKMRSTASRQNFAHQGALKPIGPDDRTRA